MTEICPCCGKPGSHYAPPSLGEPGFYICDRKMVEERTGFEKFHTSVQTGLRKGEVAAILTPGYEKTGDEPWRPIDRRVSPYKLGTGRLYVEDEGGEYVEPIDLMQRREPSFKFSTYSGGEAARWEAKLDVMLAETLATPSATGRWAACPPPPAAYNYRASTTALPESFQRFQREAQAKTRRIVDMNYAMIEARILGYLLDNPSIYADYPEVLSAKLIYAARKRTDTALVTLAVEKVVDIPVRRNWWDDFATYSYDGKVLTADIETWRFPLPPGKSIAPYWMAQYLDRVRAAQEAAVKYGAKDPDYRKFDKRKR